MSAHLQAGELVLLVDRKDRRYMVRLEDGGEFHSHAGLVAHDHLIGGPAGVHIKSSAGGTYLVVRPTLSDFVLKMPRGAQVIYPKDIGPIMMLADIFPGARVFESGLGSGAMSMALLRAGADIVGYELREDFAAKAQKNVETFLGAAALDRYQIELRDAYEGVDATNLDRAILDLPEPWQVIPHLTPALRPGGIVVAYTPSIMQAVRVRRVLDEGPYALAGTTEVLNRGWHIDGHAVRPDHRMVAHTGFLTHARRIDDPHAAAVPIASSDHDTDDSASEVDSPDSGDELSD